MTVVPFSVLALIYSAYYIFFLVLSDHGIYSENSEMIICYMFRFIFYFFFQVLGYISTYISLSDDCYVKICKVTALSFGSFCQIYRVTDEALIAVTAVWPNFLAGVVSLLPYYPRSGHQIRCVI